MLDCNGALGKLSSPYDAIYPGSHTDLQIHSAHSEDSWLAARFSQHSESFPLWTFFHSFIPLLQALHWLQAYWGRAKPAQQHSSPTFSPEANQSTLSDILLLKTCCRVLAFLDTSSPSHEKKRIHIEVGLLVPMMDSEREWLQGQLSPNNLEIHLPQSV